MTLVWGPLRRPKSGACCEPCESALLRGQDSRCSLLHGAACEAAARSFGRVVAYRWLEKLPARRRAALLFEGGVTVEVRADTFASEMIFAADDAFAEWEIARAKAMAEPKLECVETMDLAEPVTKTDADATEAEWAFKEQGR